jgi:hypothetical protein
MLINTAGQSIGAQMVTAADGSAFTGTVTVYVTIDNGTQAIGSVGSGICTHEGNGYHSYAPAQAETNGAHIAFTFVGTAAVPATVQVYTKAGDAFTRLGAPAGASVSADIAALKTQAEAIEVDTQDIQTRLPAALVSGRMDASVGAMDSNVITAAAAAADYITEIGNAANAAADTALADVGLTTTVTGRIDADVSSRLATAGYTAPLSASGTRTALGMASANLDAQLDTMARATDVASLETAIETAAAGTNALIGTPVGASLAADVAALQDTANDIKGKTDSLTFTVAGKVDANITHVIADPVQQNGSTTTAWGGSP